VRLVAIFLLPLVYGSACAETMQVKYHGPVLLDAFACSDVNDSSDISRICYDGAERYMFIRLRNTYYHYCSIDAATVRALQAASSKRQYFDAHVRGTGSDGPFDCRTHPIPKKYRLTG